MLLLLVEEQIDGRLLKLRLEVDGLVLFIVVHFIDGAVQLVFRAILSLDCFVSWSHQVA